MGWSHRCPQDGSSHVCCLPWPERGAVSVSTCVCNVLVEQSRGGCHVDSPLSLRLELA